MIAPSNLPYEVSRRGFIKTVAGASAFVAAHGILRGAQPPGPKKNLILLLTDQEKALQWVPTGWAETNLPSFTRLKNTGVEFQRAYCNSAMCTPSRNTLFTGLFPAQHGSTDTLTEDFEQSLTEHQLDPDIPNLATVLKADGYDVFYKGKWHLSKRAEGADDTYVEDDIERYGFDGWDPPDAGQDVKIENYGGGTADHDQRFVDDAVAFLQDRLANPGDRPFCLVLSLVNPHDVLGYPTNSGTGGYLPQDLLGDLELPPTVGEDLFTNYKPACQGILLASMAIGFGALPTDQMKKNYLNFYGNLLKLIDGQIGQILDVFDTQTGGSALRANTWIVRTSDHGEMAMAHGGLRQKTFNCYEETMRIPMVWSNPGEHPTGAVCDELVSHVDWLPTVCGLLGVSGWQQYQFAGIDYSRLIRNPNAGPVQDYLLFTFDDIWAGQNAAGNPQGVVPPPNRIQMLMTRSYKYARYYDSSGVAPDQEEFYDLRKLSEEGTDCDPSTGLAVELTNYSAWADNQRVAREEAPAITPQLEIPRNALQSALPQIVANRLQPRPPQVAGPPESFEVAVVEWIDAETNEPQSETQIFWVSRFSTEYQLQSSPDEATWTGIGGWIAGNNGPIIVLQPDQSLQYRLLWRAKNTPDPVVPPTPEPVASPTPTLTQGAAVVIFGPVVRTVRTSTVLITGSSESPKNTLQFKLGENGRIRHRYIEFPVWRLTIRGLRVGQNPIFFRQVDENGTPGEWTRTVVVRR